MTSPDLRELLPADVEPPTRDFLLYLAELAALTAASAKPAATARANMLGAYMPAVLRHVADLEDRLAQIAAELEACPLADDDGPFFICQRHGVIWHARTDNSGAVELYEPNGPGHVSAAAVARIRGGFVLLERGGVTVGEAPAQQAGCPVCGAPTPNDNPCTRNGALSRAGTPTCADLVAEAAARPTA